MKVALRQHEGLPGKGELEKISNWIIVLPGDISQGAIQKIPYGNVIGKRKSRLFKKPGNLSQYALDLPDKTATHLVVGLVNKNTGSFDLLSFARKLVAAHATYHPQEIGLLVHGYDKNTAEKVAEAVIAAQLAASAIMPSFKARKDDKVRCGRINLFGVKAAHAFKRTFAEAEGNELARSLSMLPSNKLTPGEYLKKVRKLARENGWNLKFYNTKTLEQKKAGAFLAVAQGSAVRDAGIVRLRYTPGGKRTQKKKLFLVGKGICYDTGGTNLKPANYMFGMHEDMQGSAVALGTLLALTRMQVNFPVECWMALAMNHIGPLAYKPNDVVTASDGTTIEVVHTDAEGRMVLADTLALASREKPDLIIDYATLTGACIYALGTAYSGVFSNIKDINQTLIGAGQACGERVWPFPMDEDYDKLIESDIADVKQCSRESGVDHILAARFLQRFVKNNVKWIHVDLSSSNRKGGLAHIPTETTGFGIRYSLQLLLDNKVL